MSSLLSLCANRQSLAAAVDSGGEEADAPLHRLPSTLVHHCATSELWVVKHALKALVYLHARLRLPRVPWA